MSTALARRHRTTQTALTSLLTLGMTDLWRSLVDERGPREVWPVLYPQMAAMVQDQRARSAEIGRQFYAQARAEAGVPGRPPTVEVPRAPAAQLETSLAVTGLTSYEKGRRAGRSPGEALDVAIVTVTGSAERLVAEGGRKAITESARSDSQALGWFRLPGPSPCWWCAMLASRGAVYGSRESASTTDDGDSYHDHCACEPWPVFSRGEELPPEVARWVDSWETVTANTDDPMAAWKAHVAEVNASQDNEQTESPGPAGGGSEPPADPPPTDPIADDGDDEGEPRVGDNLIIADEDASSAEAAYLEETRQAIANVHQAPPDRELPQIPFQFTAMGPTSQGRYRRESGNESLTISSTAVRPRMTIAHELGHFLDHQGIGDPGQMAVNRASVDEGALFGDWYDAILGSKAFGYLVAMVQADEGTTWSLVQQPDGTARAFVLDADAQAHARYLAGPRELFARSYAQWIAQEGGNPAMLAELENVLDYSRDGLLEGPTARYPYQWEPDDFAPIAAALDRLFHRLGMRS